MKRQKKLRQIAQKQRQLQNDLKKQHAKTDALIRGGQTLQNALMRKFDDVLLTTDRSLGDVGGKGKNLFVWLWKTLSELFCQIGVEIKWLWSARKLSNFLAAYILGWLSFGCMVGTLTWARKDSNYWWFQFP